MRKVFIYLLAAFLVFIVGYLLIFEFVVPKIATLAIPWKWNRIPLRQTKDIAHNYLGEPVLQNKAAGFNEWARGSKGKMYFLRIYYVSDTLAVGYSIHYQYRSFLVSKNYLVDSFSIR